MHRVSATVGLLAACLALPASAAAAADAPAIETLFVAPGARPQARPVARMTPSLRRLARSAGSARAYSPWLRANTPDPETEQPKAVRTMCVRTCDGYYWPMSDTADRMEIMRDASACISSCRSEARLFTLPRGSADIAAMTDLSGRIYGALDTAFHYRKALKPGCGCQPAPWSEAAQRQHARYAEREAVAAARTTDLAQPPPLSGARPAGLDRQPSAADKAPIRHAANLEASEAGASATAASDAQAAPEIAAPAVRRAAVERRAAQARARRQHSTAGADRKRMADRPPGRGFFAW